MQKKQSDSNGKGYFASLCGLDDWCQKTQETEGSVDTCDAERSFRWPSRGLWEGDRVQETSPRCPVSCGNMAHWWTPHTWCVQLRLWPEYTGHAGHHCSLGTQEQPWHIELGHSRVQVGRKWFHCTSFWSSWLIFTTYHLLMQKKKKQGGMFHEKCQRGLSIPFCW